MCDLLRKDNDAVSGDWHLQDKPSGATGDIFSSSSVCLKIMQIKAEANKSTLRAHTFANAKISTKNNQRFESGFSD